MKRILITGANSYIGTSFEKWVLRYPHQYVVDTLDMKNDTWRNMNFSNYEIILYVAGIVHTKETKKNAELFFKINRDLTYEVALKAKSEGVKHFIFLSSMSVYSYDCTHITLLTEVNPQTEYGKSKLQAEELLFTLKSASYLITIIRPPMVYGKSCKGNYLYLRRLALTLPFFPKIENRRSMIYIFNLCEFIRILIDYEMQGIFFPQNEDYTNTAQMVKLIAEVNNKKIVLTKLFNPLLLKLKFKIINKVFGDMYYSKDISSFDKKYCVYSLHDSISDSEV